MGAKNEKKRKVKDENFYSVFGWMTNPRGMNLHGLELDVYAIIYASSQAEKDCFYGSIQYLSEFTGASERGVQKVLSSLVDKGYLLKEQIGYNKYEYRAVVIKPKDGEHSSPDDEHSSPDDEQSSPSMTNRVRDMTNTVHHDDEHSSPDDEQSSPNNIYILNTENIYKNKKQNPLDRLINEKVKEAFEAFMEMRKLINKPMTQRAITTAINKLETLAPNDFERQVQIIDQSISNCWAGLFQLKEDNTFSNSETKKKQFNNFSQRENMDYEALEKKMTGGV